MKQGSPEWIAARVGKVTASRVVDVLAKVKSGEAASRATYRAELVAERLTGRPAGSDFTNAAMRWGTEAEPMARAAYEAERGLLVRECGLIDHPTIPHAAASPDGLVGAGGLVEIKCPDTKQHIETLLDERAPAKYLPQMQWQMACTDRSWCDFVSFDPRMPADLQLFVTRVHRDRARIEEMERDVAAFLAEVERMVAALIAKRVLAEVAP